MHATGPVASIHREPVSELYFPKDDPHSTDTDYRTKPANDEPANYYFEYPEMPEENEEAEPEKEEKSPVKAEVEEHVAVPHQKSSEDTEALIRSL